MPDSPWDIDESGYRNADSAAGRLKFLVRYAVLAPSGHNTQPWLFRVDNETLDLIADRTRALPVVDPDDRALTISCGAALFNLRVAAAHFGAGLDVAYLPDGDDPDLLARVRLRDEPGSGPADEMEALFDAIPIRRTTRRKFEDTPLGAALEDAIAAAAQAHNCGVAILTDEAQKQAVGRLIAEGDRIQFGDPSFRRELAAWIHSRRAATKDGISGQSMMGMPDMLSFAGAWAVRTFDMGDGVAAKDEQIAAHAPAIAVLHTPRDRPADWLAAGEAMEHMLLTITAAGATYAYLNQPIEVASLRPRLRDAIGAGGVPQILIRIGFGPEIAPAARRPAEEVLVS